MSETIRVDIWSDIACPWCYIGKHRFADAVTAFTEKNPTVQVEVESHSYELAPDTPEDFAGSEVDFLVKHKGMPREQVTQMLGQMGGVGAAEGIEFNFDRVQHVNTRRAHRLLHLAKEHGVQAELQELLFAAYFRDGKNLADVSVLSEIAVAAGLQAEDAVAALSDADYAEAVDLDIQRAQMLGVTGVPFFLFEEKYSVGGAQPAESFENVLDQVLKLERDAAAEGAAGSAE